MTASCRKLDGSSTTTSCGTVWRTSLRGGGSVVMSAGLNVTSYGSADGASRALHGRLGSTYRWNAIVVGGQRQPLELTERELVGRVGRDAARRTEPHLLLHLR